MDTVLNQGKIYEVLIHAKDLPAATSFCARHDQSALVLDHLGKPDINNESASNWAKRLKPLADQEHVFCKLSGIITEVGPVWQEEALFPYIDVVLELFGPERLMFGSDWPVCLLSGEHDQVCQLIEKAVGQLSVTEQSAIWGGNACEIYQLG